MYTQYPRLAPSALAPPLYEKKIDEYCRQTHTLPEVEAFLGREYLASFIGGKSIDSGKRSSIPTIDPGSGEKLADVLELTAEEVDKAVHIADTAFKQTSWATMPVNERAADAAPSGRCR